nr:transposase domain-containing protein [Sinorhizobium meliloti]
MNGLDPQAYLADVLDRASTNCSLGIGHLLPSSAPRRPDGNSHLCPHHQICCRNSWRGSGASPGDRQQ